MPNPFSVRTATADDKSAVGLLLDASYSALMKRGYDDATLSAALPNITQANPILLSSGTYYVAEAEGERIVGCGGWTVERPGNGEVEAGLGHICHFGTHPDWIGHGVGTSIFARCERAARAQEVNRFECYASLNAERFYAGLGFEVAGPIDIKLGPDLIFPSILMTRSI